MYRNNNEPIEEPSDEELERWDKELNEVLRPQAEQYILNKYKECIETGHYRNVWNTFAFHSAIWYASTEILPKLEIQVVIDGDNNCYVTTGSAGYVEFGMQPPIGMKLPIKCWIHTHPFGSAYFSGVDIRTVSIWDTNMHNAIVHICVPNMHNAIVLGGYNHWGAWNNNSPNELTIYVNGREDRIQKWAGEEE